MTVLYLNLCDNEMIKGLVALSGIKFKIFNNSLNIASDNFSYVLKVMISLLSHSIYRQLEN